MEFDWNELPVTTSVVYFSAPKSLAAFHFNVRHPFLGAIYFQRLCILGPAYNEFCYNEHPAITSRFVCIKITDSNVKKFGYNEYSLATSSFPCIFLLVTS